MTWWKRLKAWWVEVEPPREEPPLLEQPLPEVVVIQAPEPPPPVSLIYLRERGTAVFIPFAIFPESFSPEAHGGMLVGCSVMRVEMSVQDAFGLIQGTSCFRGFHDLQIQALRSASPMEVTRDFLAEKARDK